MNSMPKHHIISSLIVGPKCSPSTESMIRGLNPGKGDDADIGFTVFKTTVTDPESGSQRSIFCCWSGGRITPDKQPELTPVGHGAVEALVSMLPKFEGLIFAELRMGKTPLQDKVIARILDAPPDTRICFVGDLAGELDGQMSLAFNITGEPIELS